jgi:hypothetical protein
MAVAPGRTALTSPSGGSVPGGLIAAAGYVSTRSAYPYRKHENRKSKDRPMEAGR